MYKVELTEGEIGAILVDYNGTLRRLEEYVEKYDSEANVLAESAEKAKEYIGTRANYLMTKLDMGH